MAKYQIFEPAFVAGQYYVATRENPETVVLADEEEPSRKWVPLDDGAKAAQKRLADFDALPPKERLARKEKQEVEKKAALADKAREQFSAPKDEDTTALAKANVKPGHRTADKSPV